MIDIKRRGKNLLNKLLVILWPERCIFCRRVCQEKVCPECRERIRPLYIREPRCMKCGKPVDSFRQEYCYDCAHTYHHYDRGVGLWLHREPISASIYQFKYHNKRSFGKYYAQVSASKFGGLFRRWRINIIIPIPLHKSRRRKRGYNQAQILAEQLSSYIHIPVETRCLKRVRRTIPQKKMSEKERKHNLKNAFTVDGRIRDGVRVLLVDDIYTTGSTVDAAALALKRAGAQKVYFLTISIGQGY